MNANTHAYVLDHLGSTATDEMVHAEFDGLTQEEILAKLDEWFPSCDNEKLAEMNADFVK